jgi:hypothetical protein
MRRCRNSPSRSEGPPSPGPGPLIRLWVRGITHPAQAMQALPHAGGPRLGLRTVLTRFLVTDLIETLPQALLGRRPFTPTRLPIPPQRHYRAQLVYLPAFGVAAWLLMGDAAHGLLRLSRHHSDLGRVLDVVGVGMLVPMPPLWAADVVMLATNTFRLPGLAVTHAVVQAWETALFGVGLHTVLGCRGSRRCWPGSPPAASMSYWAPGWSGEPTARLGSSVGRLWGYGWCQRATPSWTRTWRVPWLR